MHCDACHQPLIGSEAVLLRPCGHRVHMDRCEGAACKACKRAADCTAQWIGLGLMFVGLVCGVCVASVATAFAFADMQNVKELERAISDVQCGLAKMVTLAFASPELQPAIKRSLDQIGAVIRKELSACGV